MAFRRLISQVITISANGDVRSIRNDKGNTVGIPETPDYDATFADQGMVQAVLADGTYAVLYKGQIKRGHPTTDEPIRAGQVVWISITTDGDFVVLGSAG